MDFNLTQEQKLLGDSLRRWATKDYSFDRRKQIIHSDSGVSGDAWAALTDLGLLALPVPEAQGGFNASAIDMLVVMQELGRALFVEPYFPTVCGVEFLRHAGGQYAAMLQQIAAGKLTLACALGEKQSRHELHDVATTAVFVDAHYVLNGCKTVVQHGAQAGWLIVSARSHGERRNTQGLSLFVVSADSVGLSRLDYRTVDGMRAADITFSNVRVPATARIGAAGEGWPLLDRVADFAVSMLCSEAVGVMDALYADTLDYLKTRQQFGVPIGKFQALQHRIVDIFIELEQARSMSILAAAKARSDDVVERRRTVSAAKARVGRAAKFVGQQAIQLHGGIGMTNELKAAHYFKRLTVIELTLGDSDHHLQRFVNQPSFSCIE